MHKCFVLNSVQISNEEMQKKKKKRRKCLIPLNNELQEQSFHLCLKRIYMDEEEAVRGKSK